LEPWKNTGITRKMIKEATEVERLSHYQIIDHKLYRNDEALFPFRYLVFMVDKRFILTIKLFLFFNIKKLRHRALFTQNSQRTSGYRVHIEY